MHYEQQNLKAIAINPATVNSGSFSSLVIDTLGYDEVCYTFIMGNTDAAITVLKVQEATSNTAPSWNDITGAAYTGSALPAKTNSRTSWDINVPMNGSRARYQRLVVTVGAGDQSHGCDGAAIAILNRPQVSGYVPPNFSGFSGWTTSAIS